MYKIERNKKYVVQLALDDEVLNIKLDGLKQLRKYIEAQGRLVDIQKKLDNMKTEETTEEKANELIQFLGNTVIYLFEVLFGESNTQKILDFFEGNYDEMMTAIMPFINKEIVPTLRKMADEESKAVVEKIKKG